MKKNRKQAILNELKEMFWIVLYLAGSLSLLETYKSLILLQQGVNAFSHNYTVALVESVALGKIVAIMHNRPLLQPFKDKPRAWRILYQSIMMTLIVDLGGMLEDHFFPRAARLLAESGNPFALAVTHQLVSLAIFFVLFTFKSAEHVIGAERMWRFFFDAPVANSESAHEPGAS